MRGGVTLRIDRPHIFWLLEQLFAYFQIWNRRKCLGPGMRLIDFRMFISFIRNIANMFRR